MQRTPSMSPSERRPPRLARSPENRSQTEPERSTSRWTRAPEKKMLKHLKQPAGGARHIFIRLPLKLKRLGSFKGSGETVGEEIKQLSFRIILFLLSFSGCTTQMWNRLSVSRRIFKIFWRFKVSTTTFSLNCTFK